MVIFMKFRGSQSLKDKLASQRIVSFQVSERVISNLAIVNPRSQNRELGHPHWYKNKRSET